jgi:hypothetical protein
MDPTTISDLPPSDTNGAGAVLSRSPGEVGCCYALDPQREESCGARVARLDEWRRSVGHGGWTAGVYAAVSDVVRPPGGMADLL